MKKRIWVMTLVTVLALSVVTIGCPPVVPVEPLPVVPEPPEPIVWRVQCPWGTGLLAYQPFVRFAERVKEMSGGRLIIEPFPAGAIVGAFETFDAVRGGLFEGFQGWPAWWTGKDAAFASLCGIAMGFPESWQLDAWFWERGGLELARELYAQFDLFFVGPVIYGTESLHFRVPVDSIADFKGMKFRTPAGQTADLIGRLGASIVILPGGEIYTALDKGIIDGAEWGVLNMNYDLGLAEVARYFVKEGFHQPSGATEFAVRMDVWQALPDDLKAIVEAAVREWSQDQWYTTDVANFAARESMLRRGNVEVVFPEAELAEARKIAMEIWTDWAAKSPASAEIIESKMAFMRHLGIIE